MSEVETREVVIRASSRRLSGTLTMPAGRDRPIPGVVLLHGFTSDRNESPIAGSDESLFLCTAQELVAHGFAVLRFDFSGHGKSEGLEFEMIELGLLIEDALAALGFLADQPEVAADSLFVLGQSMGGLVAACAAHRDPRIRAVALWNAPSNPLLAMWRNMGRGAIVAALDSGVVRFPWSEKGMFRLRDRFFESLIEASVLDEMAQYSGRLFVVCGLHDELVNPQPQTAKAFIHVHGGEHKILMLDADHTLNTTFGERDQMEIAIEKTTSWFRESLPT